MSIETFSRLVYASRVATMLRENIWVIPTIQTIHILAIAVLVGSALVSNLRLAGVLAADLEPATVVRRYLPWAWSALVLLLLTGLVMMVAEPGRTLGNAVFWTKMALVLFAFLLTRLLQKPLLDARAMSSDSGNRSMTKSVAWLSLAVWAAVIFCGRFIAYS